MSCRTVNIFWLCKMQLHYLDLLNVTLRTQDWKTLHTAPSYVVYRYTEMYCVNESFQNKAVTGIVVYVSCYCALNLLSICTFTPHIRQTLAIFPATQFPPQLVNLVQIGKFMFLSIRCTRCSSFSILMCLELLYVNDQIIPTATLTYLILISNSERQHKISLLVLKF